MVLAKWYACAQASHGPHLQVLLENTNTGVDPQHTQGGEKSTNGRKWGYRLAAPVGHGESKEHGGGGRANGAREVW